MRICLAPTHVTDQGLPIQHNTTSFVEKDDWRADALKLIIDSALDFFR